MKQTHNWRTTEVIRRQCFTALRIVTEQISTDYVEQLVSKARSFIRHSNLPPRWYESAVHQPEMWPSCWFLSETCSQPAASGSDSEVHAQPGLLCCHVAVVCSCLRGTACGSRRTLDWPPEHPSLCLQPEMSVDVQGRTNIPSPETKSASHSRIMIFIFIYIYVYHLPKNLNMHYGSVRHFHDVRRRWALGASSMSQVLPDRSVISVRPQTVCFSLIAQR